MTAFATVEEAWRVLCDGDDEHVRAEAIVFLGENRYAPSVPRLADLVRQADPGTRYLAAKALGQIGDEAEAAVPTLLNALRDNDMFLRAGIAGALIQIGPPAVPGLTQALFDPSSAVKRAACKALGKIGSERAVPALKYSLNDSNAGVRKFAREALKRIDTPEARAALGGG
ncbi:MAG: HEAT repeat domain-containing protein [Chloroflexota bacterium]|nr:HEAT repeat domain-containing protein [Chloroflexota bacterium]MDE2949813.1 HEAT repeat domain-containing protein [Chloroflexota bacterium]